jgi:hypothetical protein
MRRWIIGIVGILFAGVVSPAFGGVVYVPVVKNSDIQGVKYETRLWASNEGGSGRAFATLFFAENTDGTERGDDPPVDRVGVPAGATIVVTALVDEGAVGLLEIEAAPQLAFQARVLATSEKGQTLGSFLPIISSENLIGGGEALRLEPLGKFGTQVTDFYVINGGEGPAECTAQFFRANGQDLGSAAVFAVKPRSMRAFDDVLGILGASDLSGVRASLSCDQEFYAFALVTDQADGEVVSVLPSALGTSELDIPGRVLPPEPCPEGASCFDLPGDIFVATNSDRRRQIAVPVPKNSEYNQLRVDFDFVHGGWYSRLPDGIHNIFYLTRTGGYSGHTYGFTTTRGPNRNFVRNEVTVDLGRGANIKASQGVQLSPGREYHVAYTYDWPSKDIQLVISEKASGRVVVNITMDVARRIRTQGGTWYIVFSDNAAEAHVPGLGWKWSNLVIQFIP